MRLARSRRGERHAEALLVGAAAARQPGCSSPGRRAGSTASSACARAATASPSACAPGAARGRSRAAAAGRCGAAPRRQRVLPRGRPVRPSRVGAAEAALQAALPAAAGQRAHRPAGRLDRLHGQLPEPRALQRKHEELSAAASTSRRCALPATASAACRSAASTIARRPSARCARSSSAACGPRASSRRAAPTLHLLRVDAPTRRSRRGSRALKADALGERLRRLREARAPALSGALRDARGASAAGDAARAQQRAADARPHAAAAAATRRQPAPARRRRDRAGATTSTESVVARAAPLLSVIVRLDRERAGRGRHRASRSALVGAGERGAVLPPLDDRPLVASRWCGRPAERPSRARA